MFKKHLKFLAFQTIENCFFYLEGTFRGVSFNHNLKFLGLNKKLKNELTQKVFCQIPVRRPTSKA